MINPRRSSSWPLGIGVSEQGQRNRATASTADRHRARRLLKRRACEGLRGLCLSKDIAKKKTRRKVLENSGPEQPNRNHHHGRFFPRFPGARSTPGCIVITHYPTPRGHLHQEGPEADYSPQNKTRD